MIVVRTFTPGDENAIRDLFALCFGKEMPREEWAWKYKNSPSGSTAAIALDDDKIVAHYGGLRMKFHYRGKSFDVLQPCDVMTRPDYRARIFSKRGAMIRAGEHFYEANPMDFAFGFPSERHAILGTKQLGYTKHEYVTVLNKRVSAFRRMGNPLLKIEKGWNFIKGHEIDRLWEETKDRQGLAILKDSRYIFWRYKDNPVKRYEPLIVRKRFSNAIKAFAVFSFGDSQLSILDFFSAGKTDVRILLELFEGIAVRNGLDSISLWANPHEEVFNSLLDHGFTREKGMPYIFRIISSDIDPAFLFTNYYHRMGDYDVS
jgi:hypothetical protein